MKRKKRSSAWRPGTMGAIALGAVGATFGVLTWGDDGEAASRTHVEIYAAGLRIGSEIDDGAGVAADPGEDGNLADEWLAEGRRAFDSPVAASLPFLEEGRLSSNALDAVAYRFHVSEGQVIEATIGEATYFVELYRSVGDVAADGAADDAGRSPGDEGRGSAETIFVAEADSSGSPIVHEVLADADYLLRILPRPFEGGPYTVEITANGVFAFPVAERGPRSIISRFGAPRDGGTRSHEGVDIIAPRGTPVLAATTALVYDVGTSEIGGNYVWLQDWSRRKEIYYAHLEESWVDEGMVVEPGDPIGSVGNTGNASTTAPHLHFGVYDLDRDLNRSASDPLPYIVPLRTRSNAHTVEK